MWFKRFNRDLASAGEKTINKNINLPNLSAGTILPYKKEVCWKYVVCLKQTVWSATQVAQFIAKTTENFVHNFSLNIQYSDILHTKSINQH